ncbi:RNA-directed DNA polymerase [Handroanthus impetiginosus]|uniref:RNA-directed DNA polymerase n=1 Tax=Handroanthus impetiginosus TaxID=429701 RepID=A0A2G9FX70_9LAMI|nr:RNA-directed DNA polymerase [Handroanthus impetiginosus]
MSQVQELQTILHEIHAENMNYLKHKRKEIGFEDLIVRLRIEEDNRMSKIKIGGTKLEGKGNLVEPNSNTSKQRKSQWTYTSTTRHICSENSMLSTYTPTTGRKLYIGNSATSDIVNVGVELNDVFHAPDKRKNLVSGSLLVKYGCTPVFEFDRLVIIENGQFVGRGYVENELFKFDVMPVLKKC